MDAAERAAKRAAAILFLRAWREAVAAFVAAPKATLALAPEAGLAELVQLTALGGAPLVRTWPHGGALFGDDGPACIVWPAPVPVFVPPHTIAELLVLDAECDVGYLAEHVLAPGGRLRIYEPDLTR